MIHYYFKNFIDQFLVSATVHRKLTLITQKSEFTLAGQCLCNIVHCYGNPSGCLNSNFVVQSPCYIIEVVYFVVEAVNFVSYCNVLGIILLICV